VLGAEVRGPVSNGHICIWDRLHVDVYMSEDGDLICLQGKLEQPNVHYLYRSFFNAVDVHNNLAVGPRSVSGVCVGPLCPSFCG
jgi:hypothetical protein